MSKYYLEISSKIQSIPPEYESVKNEIMDLLKIFSEDRQKLLSDGIKLWPIMSGSIIWAVMLIIIYKITPFIAHGFVYTNLGDIYRLDHICILIIFATIAISFLVQVAKIIYNILPFNSEDIFNDVIKLIEDIKEYKIDINYAIIKMKKISDEKKIFIALSYENKIKTMNSRREIFIIIDAVCVIFSILASGTIISDRDATPACYPMKFEEISNNPDGQKCWQQIQAWRNKKTQ